jgi:hypothetical protein
MPVAVAARKLLDDAREAVVRGRALLRGRDLLPVASPSGILDTYDSLCRMLDGVDAGSLDATLQRVSRELDRLRGFADDVERLRRLRGMMREI